jgi:hypothetical protein
MKLSSLVGTPWIKKEKLEEKAYAGMDRAMKKRLREVAAELSKREEHKVSMSEVIRRLCDAAGIK